MCVCAGVVPARYPKIRRAPSPHRSLLPLPLHCIWRATCDQCVSSLSPLTSPTFHPSLCLSHLSLPSQLTPCRICSVCHASFATYSRLLLRVLTTTRVVLGSSCLSLLVCVCMCVICVCVYMWCVCVLCISVCVCVKEGICVKLNGA